MPLQKIILSLLLATGLVACSAVNNASQTHNTPKLQSLLELNNLNERAFEFYQNCPTGKEPINQNFVKNYSYTSNLLFDEAMHETSLQADNIVHRITSRRTELQKDLKKYYQQEGCNSSEALMAGEHYKSLSHINTSQIDSYIIR